MVRVIFENIICKVYIMMHNTSIVPMTSTSFINSILTTTAMDTGVPVTSSFAAFITRPSQSTFETNSLIDTLSIISPTSTINNSNIFQTPTTTSSGPSRTLESINTSVPTSNQTPTVQIANDGVTSKTYMLSIFTMIAFCFMTI